MNLDFEQGQPGEMPPGWFMPRNSQENDYKATIVTEKPEGGRQAALLALEGDRKGDQVFGTMMTSFDAASYRGKRIRFRAAVRVEVPTPQDKVGLWLRVDREGSARGFFDNMGNRPITSADWKTYEIVGEVALDAKAINLGLLLAGSGKAWIDSASVETLDAVLATPAAGIEPARPLTARGLDNLVAFTRLLGYVRFFHPSDQAASADWDRLAIAGVQIAEKAAGPEELARSLEDFFRPVAPTVRVYPTAGPKPEPPKLEGTEAVYWEHVGVKLGDQPSVYGSKRVSTLQGAPAGGGGAMQYLETPAFKGKRVVVRAAARAEVQGPHKAELRVKPYRWDGAPMTEQMVAVTSSDWRVYETAVDVPQEADGLAIRLVLASEGRVWWDDVSLDISPESGGAPPEVKNAGFEEEDEDLPDWAVSRTDRRAGYQAVSSDNRPRSGRRSLLVSWTEPESTGAPRPGETFAADLGGGVSALIPLAVYKDAQGTLPHVAPEVKPASGKPEGFVPTGDDRATRLAGVALAWNVFQHFYPYFDVVQSDWPAELRKALKSAATDTDAQAFVFTLRRLMTALHDGHGHAYRANQDMSVYGMLPVLWDWIEDQLVITEVASGTEIIRRGDVVLSIAGRPAREVIAVQKEMAPGATDAFRTWRTLRRMLVGKRDEPVRIEGRHPDGEAFTVTLKRSLSAEVPVLEETRPEKIAEVRPGIFYVDISRIEDADFKAALDRLAAAKGIVFDLRGYPNGSTVIISHLTDKPVSSARWTVPVVTRPDRQGWIWDVSSWDVQPKQPRLKGKAVFMTDGRAISYAETYMGIIGHHKLAEIVGAPTAGTNGNVNPFTIPGGYTLPWTGMRVLKHDGSRHHGIGILPTIPASRTLKGVAEGRDEVLEKAIAAAGGGPG